MRGTTETAEGVRAEEKRRGRRLADFLVRLVKEKPLGTVGGVITLILFFTAIFCELLAPYGMNELVDPVGLSPPSAKYPLGTDQLGRDVLSRIIFGARVSVIVGLAATAFSVVVSTVIGVLCGYLGGKFDLVAQRFVDAWMAFPGLILLIVALSLVGQSMVKIIICLGLLLGITGSRIVRSAVIGIKENIYVYAAGAIGCSTMRTMYRHILPNVMAPIIILFTTRIPTMIMIEASLSFLGFGIPPPAPTWGGMLSIEGRRFMLESPGLAIWPGLALASVVYGINMFGDAIRDLLDPRLKGGVGRYSGVKPRLEKEKKKGQK